MSNALQFSIHNVRRVKQATLSLPLGSRTILVGRNNSGKTTILDTIARSLWSLPVGALADELRSFHVSWYRYAGGAYHQPRVTVRVPVSVLGPALCTETNGHFAFEQEGRHPHGRVSRTSDLSTTLETRTTAVGVGETSWNVIEALPNNHVRWTTELERKPWQPLNPLVPSGGHRGGFADELYAQDNPLFHAIRALSKRTVYLPASRVPKFGATRGISDFSQDNLLALSSLLVGLRAIDLNAFEGIGAGLGAVFPDVRGLSLAQQDGGVVPMIEFSDGRVEFAGNVGFGLQNILHQLIVLSMAPCDPFVLIDEPETGLNQSCLRDFATLVETIRPDATLVIATQSEAFCRGFSASSNVVLMEAEEDVATLTSIDLREQHALRRLAHAMGIDPIFLIQGGKIIYVEGGSDETVFGQWLKLAFPHLGEKFQVVALEGCGKIGQAFVKPLLKAYCDRVFVVLDSDRSGHEPPMSPDIERLASWLTENHVGHYVLKRRELENYLGADAIAQAVGIHATAVAAPPGHEYWYDIKAAFRRADHHYNERQHAIQAFDVLTEAQRRNLFAEETTAIVQALRAFLMP